MKKGDILHLTIEDVTFGSEGLARSNGKVIFVAGTLPDEEVEVKIIRKKRDFAQAKVISFLKKSNFRHPALCEHYPVCGGCKWQDVQYSYQLELKHHIVSETLRRLGGFEKVPVLQTIPSPELFGYRNKMEFSFSAQRWILQEEPEPPVKSKDFTLGLHIPTRFDKVLDIDQCWLQSDFANQVLQAVKDFAFRSNRAAWHSHNHEGFWRNLIIREGKNTGQKMVNVVTYDYDHDLMRDFCKHLKQKFPDLTSIINNITQSKSGSAFGEKEIVLAGQPFIEEKIGEFIFEISANAFFQTNTKQAENLYQKALEFARVSSNDIIYDLYSGTGAISIFFSKSVRKVVGIELIEASVKNAIRNAQKNQATHCEYVAGDLREELRNIRHLLKNHGKPKVLILDPPRAGVHPKSIQGILSLKPERIVYISCNPATFARDAKELCKNDFELLKIQPVDMFPHTYHIELVALLERRK